MTGKSITGIFDLNFLNECKTPMYSGANSLGFQLQLKKSESIYLKFSKIPEEFSLIKSQDQLRKICSFRSDLVIPFLDICLLENPFYFSGHYYNLVTLHPFKKIKPIGFYEEFSSIYQTLINYWILKGFNDLHCADILHGDVNIQNIGFATFLSKTIPIIFDINIYQITSTNKKEIFISPEFMAPEVFQFGNYDLKSELWAMGVLLFTIHTKEFPFGLRSGNSKAKNIFLNMSQKNIERIVEKSPQSIKKIVKGLLKLNPTERISTGECLELIKKETKWFIRPFLN